MLAIVGPRHTVRHHVPLTGHTATPNMAEQHLPHAERPVINLAKFYPDTLDITSYLNVTHRVLHLSLPRDQEKISVVLTNLDPIAGRVVHRLTNTTTWDEFCNILIQTMQPSLGTVGAEIRHINAILAELQQHIIANLLSTFPKAVADHFTLHDPVGFDQDIHTIKKILISHTNTKAVNTIHHPTIPSPRRAPERQSAKPYPLQEPHNS